MANAIEQRRPISVFMVSTSWWRVRAAQEAMDHLGIAGSVIPVSGPHRENGARSTDKAMHKVCHALEVGIQDGYFERNPTTHVVYLAADSRNIYESKKRRSEYRDKPENQDDFYAHVDEWERIARGEARVFTHTGYAVVSMNGRVQSASLERISETHVISSHLPQKLLAWSFGEQQISAHSITAQKTIFSGDIKVTDPMTGRVYPEHAAVQTIMGAEPRMFKELLSSVLFS